MKKIILLTLLSISYLFVFSQITKMPEAEILHGAIKSHLEFDKAISEDNTIIPLDNKELIVAYMPKQKAVANMKDFELKKFDANLKVIYTVTTTLPAKSKMVDYKVEAGFLYGLFQHNNGISIVKLNIANKNTEIYKDSKYGDFTAEKMVVNKGIVTISGIVVTNRTQYTICCILSAPCLFFPLLVYTLNSHPALFSVDMTNEGLFLNDYSMNNYKKNGVRILEMQTGDSSVEVNLLMQKTKRLKFNNETKEYDLTLKTFTRTTDGKKLLPESTLKYPHKTFLTNMRLNVLEDNEQITFGTYKEKLSFGTVGFFINSFKNNEYNIFNTIPWSSFKFYDTKIFKFANINVFFSDFIDKGNERVFLGEVYSSVGSGKNFSGYKHYGAILFGLDENGKLLWDNFIEINGPQAILLQEHFLIHETGDNQYSILLNDGPSLTINTIDKENNEKSVKSVKIEGGELFKYGFNSDGVYSAVIHWYDNVYLVSGMKKLKEKSNNGIKNNKTVFYVDKVELPF